MACPHPPLRGALSRHRERADRERRADWMIDWPKVAKKVNGLYASPEGRPAYPPITMVRIIVLQPWYDASDAAIEETVSDRLSFRRFAGLTLQDAVPDHSTVSRFRKEVAERGLARRLFAEVNRQLEGKGLLVKKGALIDASAIKAQAPRLRSEAGGRRDGRRRCVDAQGEEVRGIWGWRRTRRRRCSRSWGATLRRADRLCAERAAIGAWFPVGSAYAGLYMSSNSLTDHKAWRGVLPPSP